MLMEEDREDRVSLAGLDPQAALKALLAVDPDAPPADKNASDASPTSAVEREDDKRT
jgi:hypothetical protein